MRSFIVSGTDTDVGKSVLSALLMAALPEYFYWKPVQSGTEEETDSVRVRRLSHCEPERILTEGVVLRNPRSPHEAARLEKRRIDPSMWTMPQIRPLIIEGAGGLLVPLTDDALFIDVFKEWSLPVLLACRSGLGTINHTLLSLEALSLRSIPILGVVTIGALHESNEAAIEHYGHTKVVGRIPSLSDLSHQTLLQTYRDHFSLLNKNLRSEL